jgi:hypothetical protein
VTEAEWLACTDLRQGTDIGTVFEPLRGKASRRKLRLFAVACCRRTWHLLPDDDARRAVEVAEQFADGRANREALDEVARAMGGAGVRVHESIRKVARATGGAAEPARESADVGGARRVALWAYDVVASVCGEDTGPHATRRLDWTRGATRAMALACHMEWQATVGGPVPPDASLPYYALLRDIVGPLPFRPVVIEPAWLRWNWGTVPAIARTIYEERAYHELPILADALMDAGCCNEEVLAHCRSPGPHVRGCWVVDLLLGRE